VSKTTFKKFIERERTVESRQRNIDWVKKKQLFLKRVDALFADVEKFLKEFTESIRLEKVVTKIDEDYVGEYESPALRIHLYGKRADLVPVGTNVIGTPGRVDLRGRFDTIRLILVDKNEKSPQVFAGISWAPMDQERVREEAEEWMQKERNYVWKIITDPPDVQYIELKEDSFLKALQEVLDG
jgi:hypothetical protein